MTKALTEDEKALRCYERAVTTALATVQEVIDLHVVNKDTDFKYCALCFENWPCRTNKFATTGLAKMKGQLPR